MVDIGRNKSKQVTASQISLNPGGDGADFSSDDDDDVLAFVVVVVVVDNSSCDGGSFKKRNMNMNRNNTSPTATIKPTELF